MRGVHLYTLFDIRHRDIDYYTLIYNAFPTKPSDEISGYFETMIDALEVAGSLQKCDLFQWFSAHTRAASLINWANPGVHDPAEVNNPAWEQYKGFSCVLGPPVGYIRCHYNPTDDANNYGLNDATVIIGVDTTDLDESEFGCNDGDSIETRINGHASFSGTKVRVGINAAIGSYVTSEIDGVGYVGGVRSGSSQIDIWQNKSKTNVNQNSVSIPDAEFYATSANIPAGQEYMDKQIRFVWVSSALTDQEYQDTIDAIETCLDSLDSGLIQE